MPEYLESKGLQLVDVKEAVGQALRDSERFGVCFLSWGDVEDRHEIMKLRELRVVRSGWQGPRFSTLNATVLEWTDYAREVLDFAALGAGDGHCPVVVAGTLSPDPGGQKLSRLIAFLEEQDFVGAVFEGPREVEWAALEGWARGIGFETYRGIRQAEGGCFEPVFKLADGVNPDHDPLLPRVGGHVWVSEGGRRQNVYRLNAPGRWPLWDKETKHMELDFIVDKKACVGTARRLSGLEVWLCQGRSEEEWKALARKLGPGGFEARVQGHWSKGGCCAPFKPGGGAAGWREGGRPWQRPPQRPEPRRSADVVEEASGRTQPGAAKP